MFDVKINTLEGSIRLTPDGLDIRRGAVHVFLTPPEYAWLPVHHRRGKEMTVTGAGGEITLLPHIADAVVILIDGLSRK